MLGIQWQLGILGGMMFNKARTGLFVLLLPLFVSLFSCTGIPQEQTGTEPARPTGLPGGTGYSPDDRLPLAPELVKRVLPNGLTVYVRANGNPGAWATMYLIVAGGSSVENDDELGYAHFVEHMAFNGTKSFPENELVNYMRSIGMAFGAEVNAYTGREETLYSLDVPLSNPEYFQTGIQILKEWATEISFDPLEVEKEKGVILEERRRSLGAGELARNREIPELLKGSRHADREPIGTEESIRNATAEKLRAFYERTYRPEHMAVIVVGNINPAQVAAQLEAEFSFASKDGIIEERAVFNLEPIQELRFVSTLHENFSPSVIHYEKIVPYNPEHTIRDYEHYLKLRIAAEAIRLRLSDLSRKGDKAWREAYFDDDYFYGVTRIYMFALTARPGKELDAFSDLALEVERLRLHGFTESEFSRTLAIWQRWVLTLDMDNQNLKSRSFADEYQRNFMYNEPVPGIVNERVYIKRALDNLTIEELNAACREILGEDEGFVALRTRDEDAIKKFDRDAFDKALENARLAMPAKLLVTESEKTLKDIEPLAGEIVDEIKHPNGITELSLSNGARVLLKPTSFKTDEVLFAAWSPGGYYSLPLDKHYLAILADTLLSASGLWELDAIRLDELTAELNAGIGWTIGSDAEYIYGKSTRNDMEPMLKLVYLSAVEPGQDAGAFYQVISQLTEQLEIAGNYPDFLFQNAWNSDLFADNPRTRTINAEDLANIDFEETRKLVKDSLAAAGDFTYILVGDFSLATARELSKKYLASIPEGRPSEKPSIEVLVPGNGSGKRLDYHFTTDDRASVVITWANETEWSWEREESLELLSIALNNRLLDSLREDLSGTYVVNISSSLSNGPVPQFVFQIKFDCAPERVDELIDQAVYEVEALINGLTDPVYAAQAQVLAQRSYDNRMRTNDLWRSEILRSVSQEMDFNIPERVKALAQLASYENMQALAAELLKPAEAKIYVLLP